MLEGCTGKLKTKQEMSDYAKKNFGSAIVVKEESSVSESDSNAKAINYTMQDDEYKFNYTCTTSLSKLCIDNSCTNDYLEGTDCNFKWKYIEYIKNNVDIGNKYDTKDNNSYSSDDILMYVKYGNEEEAKDEASKISKIIKDIDNRNYFKNYYVGVFDLNNVYIGAIDIDNGIYKNIYEENIKKMTYEFAATVNYNNSKLDGITYLYYKRVQYKDVERLKLEWLDSDKITGDDWTTEYFFDYYGTTYFEIPDYVYIKDAEGINGSHYSEYYTSYWFK